MPNNKEMLELQEWPRQNYRKSKKNKDSKNRRILMFL